MTRDTSTPQQRTLYSLRFGLQRAKRSVQRGNDEVAREAKRTRRDAGAVISLVSDDDGEDEAKAEEKSTGQCHTGTGTTIDPSELHPVTRHEFLSQYAVTGLEHVYYQRNWVSASTAHRWRRELDALLEWYRPKLRVYGREIQQSRAIAAFSTAPGLDLKYSGHQVDMHSPFPPLLEEIAARLSQPDCLGTNVKFNHAMLNRYEDGSVHIGKHSDNVENKVIVTVSLGAPRTWIMEEKQQHRARKGKDDRQALAPPAKHRWTLDNGSLLVMQGNVQQRYTHEIPKELKIKEPRISITFRQLVY